MLNCLGLRGAKECKSDRCRQKLSNEYVRYMLRSLVLIFIFQSLAMSLFLNLLLERAPYSNACLVAKIVFDIAENEPSKVRQEFDKLED